MRARRWIPASHNRPVENYAALIDQWYAMPAVCDDDSASQIRWLESGADPALLHDAASNWNWGWGTSVLQWILSNPLTSFSSASLQVVYFCGAGSLHYAGPEQDLMATVAARLRSGFYKNNWGLRHQKITANDKDLYMRAVGQAQDKERWTLPDASFGPFPDEFPAPSDYQFDDDGRIRISFDAWKAQNK